MVMTIPAPPEDVLAVAKKFTDAGADWQACLWPHRAHSPILSPRIATAA
jgi:hypothetical protein